MPPFLIKILRLLFSLILQEFIQIRQGKYMYETYYEWRCPQCKRLLFKTVKSFFRIEHEESCSQCKKVNDCRNCSRKHCYMSLLDGEILRCPECMRDIECTLCERFYYRVWVMEKNKIVEIKCPKCKKIIKLKLNI